MLTVDGLTWNVKAKIKRSAAIEESEISGLLANREYFSDVYGTYMNYRVELSTPYRMIEDYNKLYEVLTNPVGGHTIVIPYGSGNVTINGRIKLVDDTHLTVQDGSYWLESSFDIYSNLPTKQMSLEDSIIYRGFSDLPDESDASPGEAYIYTENGWQALEDADNDYY